jgi:anti-sigma regulatory factor (Ser/Thr protein kinase)
MTERLIEFAPDIEDLSRLESELEAFAKDAALDFKLVMQLNLVLEELLTNTISYGCAGSVDHWLKVELKTAKDVLTIVLSDNAEPFDPTIRKEVDTSASLEDRGIGGLGIHIVTSMVDQLTYKRIDDVNQLTLIKNIKNSGV